MDCNSIDCKWWIVGLALAVGWGSVGCGDVDVDDWTPGAETQAHHKPDHSGGPPGSGGDDEDDDDDGINCQTDHDCDDNEACTQGGRCINVAGQECVLEELQADIDELDEAVGLGVPYELPPNAELLIEDNDVHDENLGLLIENPIILEGNGSVLIVENDLVGLRLEDSDGADWSSVKNLEIKPTVKNEEHDGIGVDVRAHGVRLENMLLRQMGTGIRAHTVVNDDEANVNTQQWTRIILRRNYHYGIDLESGDSQAGLFSGIEVHGGAGIHDRSFLGNTYLAPTIQNREDEGHESFVRDREPIGEPTGGATSILGMYVENSAADPVSKSNRDLFVGGNAVPRADTGGGRVGGQDSQLHFSNQTGEDGYVETHIPGGSHAPIGFRHDWDYLDDEEERAAYWRLYYARGTWSFFQPRTDAPDNEAFIWTGPSHDDGAHQFEVNEWLGGEPWEDDQE